MQSVYIFQKQTFALIFDFSSCAFVHCTQKGALGKGAFDCCVVLGEIARLIFGAFVMFSVVGSGGGVVGAYFGNINKSPFHQRAVKRRLEVTGGGGFGVVVTGSTRTGFDTLRVANGGRRSQGLGMPKGLGAGCTRAVEGRFCTGARCCTECVHI